MLLPAVGQRFGDNPRGAGELEIEKAVNAAGVVLGVGGQPFPRLAHQVGAGLRGLYIVVDPGEHLHVFVHRAGVELLHRVQPEAARALLQPEIHHRLKFPSEGLALKIHIGHPAPENALIIVIAGAHLVPGAGFWVPLDKVIVFVVGAFRGGRLLLLPQRLQIIAGGGEPRVLRGGVVEHQVDDQLDPPLLTLRRQPLKVGHGAVFRVDVQVVLHIVFMVGARRHHRHQPDPVEAQLLDIVQLGDDALEIAHPVAVAVAEGVDENFIPGAVVVVDHHDFLAAPALLRAAGGQAAHQGQKGQDQRQAPANPIA